MEKELDIVNSSMRFTKKDFTIGHLEAVQDKFKEITLVIDTNFRRECNSVAQLRKSKKIRILPCAVQVIIPLFLEEVKEKYPLIVYLDAFALWEYKHYPHYVIILKAVNGNYHILDPWDGKKRIVPAQQFLEGVALLKEYLHFAPRAIRCVPE